MRSSNILGLFIMVLAAVELSAADTVAHKDPNAGFELSYPKNWKTWKDSEPGNHLTLKAAGGSLMGFVLSSVLDESELPQTESVLEAWARSIYDHGDPTVQIVSCEAIEHSGKTCVRTVLIMSPKGGEPLRSEIFTFVDYYRDKSHRRMWKIFAIFPKEKTSPEELALWHEVVSSVQIKTYK